MTLTPAGKAWAAEQAKKCGPLTKAQREGLGAIILAALRAEQVANQDKKPRARKQRTA